jgi:hypothetical protein
MTIDQNLAPDIAPTVTALAAGILPGIAAAAIIPGSGLADCLACVATAAAVATGTGWPMWFASDGRTGLHCYPSTVRAAAIGVSTALSGWWAFDGIGWTVGGPLATAQLMLSGFAAWLATRRTPADVRAEQLAMAARQSGRTRSQDIREGQMAKRIADAEESALADRLKLREEEARLTAAREALEAEREAHARKVAGVPEGATGTRAEVAQTIFQANPSVGVNAFVAQLRAANVGCRKDRASSLLDVMREAAARSADADAAVLEAIWEGSGVVVQGAEAEAL